MRTWQIVWVVYFNVFVDIFQFVEVQGFTYGRIIDKLDFAILYSHTDGLYLWTERGKTLKDKLVLAVIIHQGSVQHLLFFD